MKEYAFMILVVFALVAAAFSQTTNSKYEVTFFGAPPRGQDGARASASSRAPYRRSTCDGPRRPPRTPPHVVLTGSATTRTAGHGARRARGGPTCLSRFAVARCGWRWRPAPAATAARGCPRRPRPRRPRAAPSGCASPGAAPAPMAHDALPAEQQRSAVRSSPASRWWVAAR